jgi:hypothetical protein
MILFEFSFVIFSSNFYYFNFPLRCTLFHTSYRGFSGILTCVEDCRLVASHAVPRALRRAGTGAVFECSSSFSRLFNMAAALRYEDQPAGSVPEPTRPRYLARNRDVNSLSILDLFF